MLRHLFVNFDMWTVYGGLIVTWGNFNRLKCGFQKRFGLTGFSVYRVSVYRGWPCNIGFTRILLYINCTGIEKSIGFASYRFWAVSGFRGLTAEKAKTVFQALTAFRMGLWDCVKRIFFGSSFIVMKSLRSNI